MTLSELMESLGVREGLAVDSVWPLTFHDDPLGCTYSVEVRRMRSGVQASVKMFEVAPLGFNATQHVLCNILAVSEANGWVVVSARCCGVEIRPRTAACRYFRRIAGEIERDRSFDYVTIFNDTFGPGLLPTWPPGPPERREPQRP